MTDVVHFITSHIITTDNFQSAEHIIHQMEHLLASTYAQFTGMTMEERQQLDQELETRGLSYAQFEKYAEQFPQTGRAMKKFSLSGICEALDFMTTHLAATANILQDVITLIDAVKQMKHSQQE